MTEKLKPEESKMTDDTRQYPVFPPSSDEGYADGYQDGYFEGKNDGQDGKSKLLVRCQKLEAIVKRYEEEKEEIRKFLFFEETETK